MDRRNFIAHSAMGLTLAGLNPLACISSDRPLNKKSLKWGMIKDDLSVLEKFRLIKELGFDGIELDSPSDLNMEEVLEAKAATGLEIPGLVNSLHWSKPLSDPDPSVRAECTESMISALEECKKYGGSTVLLVPAVVNDKISYDDAWSRSTKEIKKILPAAESIGVKVAIENVWNNFLLSPLEAKRYIDHFESDHIGWYMDIGNIVRYGWPEHWIKILGTRILKIDIKDYSRDKANDEGVWEGFKVKLGSGSVDWSKVNQALSEIGYSGWGSAEVAGGDRSRLLEISTNMDNCYGA